MSFTISKFLEKKIPLIEQKIAQLKEELAQKEERRDYLIEKSQSGSEDGGSGGLSQEEQAELDRLTDQEIPDLKQQIKEHEELLDIVTKEYHFFSKLILIGLSEYSIEDEQKLMTYLDERTQQGEFSIFIKFFDNDEYTQFVKAQRIIRYLESVEEDGDLID